MRPDIDALLARAHGAQVHETQVWLVPAARDPAVHAAAVAIDAIPHHFSNKSADRLEAGHAIEFGHAE